MHPKDPRNNRKHRERGPKRRVYTIQDLEAVTKLSSASLYDHQKQGHVDLDSLGSVIAFVIDRLRWSLPVHNHPTKDIKPVGSCPACDAYQHGGKR